MFRFGAIVGFVVYSAPLPIADPETFSGEAKSVCANEIKVEDLVSNTTITK